MKALIQKLTNILSPAGYETMVRQALRSEIEPWADDLHVDNLGNLIASKGQPGEGGKKIMLAAPMDEIGLAVTHVDRNGFLRFLPVGPLKFLVCPGARVKFLRGPQGVIGADSSAEKGPAFDQLFIDLGHTSHQDDTRQDVQVQIGDIAAFEPSFLDLGQRLVSKAMSARVGSALLVEILRQMSQGELQTPHQVVFVFSVQNSVGGRGAMTAAYEINPDLVILVDATEANDTPATHQGTVCLGAGPVIKVRDRDMLSDPLLVGWMAATAEKEGLPYQMEVQATNGSGGQFVQTNRAGVPTGSLRIPCRYLYSQSEMVDLDDINKTAQLLAALLRHPVKFNEI